MTFDNPEILSASSDTAIAVRHMPAKADPRAIIQINHGLAEHSLRYKRFSELLSEKGFHVYAHDHRGHGFTKALDAPIGRFATRDGMGAVLRDVDTVNNHARERHPNLPVIIFGHSLGGLVTLNYLLKHQEKVDAAAIWNANFSGGLLGRLAQGIILAERMFLGSDVPSMLLPRLTFQEWNRSVDNPRTAFDWLSRDPAEVDLYVNDPLCGWSPTVSMWRDTFDLVFTGADDRLLGKLRRDLPINLVGGAKDPATAKGTSVKDLEQRMQKLGFSDVTTKIYAHTRHEGLNEINRDLIMSEFADWAIRATSKASQ
ncbi:alpha/beta hydrolase [Phyllobacterium sp. SB3]|uniref:alpha/beta hydrolase n=1 Tax=Phyllobacterium sp. SB3 TaxID=3156073 RepID=UPI0032B017BD